jgi:tetratricopeptide (TPR) repeat protein
VNELLDLRLILNPPPADASSETVASIELRCDQLGRSHRGDLLSDPITKRERKDLRWYLEEYAEWPFDEFRERAKQIEQKLNIIGKQLYESTFSSIGAQKVLQAWRLTPAKRKQISIVSGLPRALSLPWELLHDEAGFLVLRAQQPVSILRTLALEEGTSEKEYKPPLRILMVVARPEGTGFFDPRGEARELLKALHEPLEAGAIEVEFLRPPTLPALRKRLSQSKRPIHVLHFDGHGSFGKAQHSDAKDTTHKQSGEQGSLDFEDEEGQLDLVEAEMLGQVLQGSTVSLVVLNACQSAQGADDDAFSSVAGRLIQSGQDGVVAMSASVLVAATTRYVRAFYAELAEGTPVPTAHERARQVLHDDPRRHLLSRAPDREAERVELRDWWVPHFYQQRALTLRPSRRRRKRAQVAETHDLPEPPRYGFSGRTRELHQLERALWQGKLVVIYGFGGVGKTTLAGEAADWLTQTGMYQQALFVSFEHGGDASTLLSTLGNLYGVNDASYDPQHHQEALTRLAPVLKKQPLLLVADNLESLLPGGDALLPLGERLALWETLLGLAKHHAGVLLTCRDPQVGDGKLARGKAVAHSELGGLQPKAAYQLASDLLKDLGINRARAPYADLKKLLEQLDHHPLAIQLVLPELARTPLATIQRDFAALLPQFEDDTVTGRNRSLLASLDYSLRRLSAAERALLPRLALFEGGTLEENLLAITEMPESEWATLRAALEQTALLRTEQVHPAFPSPFLRFHPVLAPSLRRQTGAGAATLRQRYAKRYAELAAALYREDTPHPRPARALAWREMPNLRRALDLLLEAGEQDAAASLADHIARFLTVFGRGRELEELRRKLDQVLPTSNGTLTEAAYLRESGLGNDELNQGKLQAALKRFTRLLARIETQPEGEPRGQGSYEHGETLLKLACCLRDAGQLGAAANRLDEALTIHEELVKQHPDNRDVLRQQSALLAEAGNVLLAQGKYLKARKAYEGSLETAEQLNDQRNQAALLGQLGLLALSQEEYPEARARYEEARRLLEALNEPATVAIVWHQLGLVAQRQGQWAEAERCYRQSLALEEYLHDEVGVAETCNQLGIVARNDQRPGEAEGWYRQGLERLARAQPGSARHATLLNNLADLLTAEIRAGRMKAERTAAARQSAEEALAFTEQLDASAGIWTTLGILAEIAELEGQTEVARAYRRREYETHAAFEGNRYHIDRRFGHLIAAVGAAARGNIQAKAAVEEVLPELEKQGWQITVPIRRIWIGERDWHTLAEGIDRGSALLLLRILETLEKDDPIEQLISFTVAAAKGHAQARAVVEEALPRLEAGGFKVSAAIHRIWAGERDLSALAEELDEQDSHLIARILDALAAPAYVEKKGEE